MVAFQSASGWRAISQSAEFGKWFGMRIEGQFAPNTTLSARKRAKAFADNESGWEIQTQLIGKYLEHAQR